MAAEAEVIDLTGLSDSSEGDDDEIVEIHQDDGRNLEDDEVNLGDNGSDAGSSGSDGNSSEPEEILVDQRSRAQLHDAIATASEARLRHVLAELVDRVPAAEQLAIKEFVTRKKRTRELVSRWESCSRCGMEFDVNTRREVDECSFHPGTFQSPIYGFENSGRLPGHIQADEDAFADWDEACQGPIDSDESRNTYPENYIWTCCEQTSNSDGCTQSKHVSRASTKRQRT